MRRSSPVKVVVFSAPFRGHVIPLLPLLDSLQAEGAEIVCYTASEYAELFAARGIEVRHYESAAIDAMRNVARHRVPLAHLGQLLAKANLEIVEKVRAEIRGAGCIIHDVICAWGMYLARLEGIPSVAFNPMFVANFATLGLARRSRFRHEHKLLMMLEGIRILRWIARFRRRYGMGKLSAPHVFAAYEKLNVTATSRAFHPAADRVGDDWIFAPPPPDEDEPVEFPWDRVEGRDVILVSSGTVFTEDHNYYETCMRAFAGSNNVVVITKGRGSWAPEPDRVPPNVIVRDFVPFVELLKRARLLVTHGGIGSVAKAFHSGVPALVIPHIAEQAVVGMRVEELGAGRLLLRHKLTPEALRAAADGILNTPSCFEAAAAVGKTLVDPDALTIAARRILEYANAECSAREGRSPLRRRSRQSATR